MTLPRRIPGEPVCPCLHPYSWHRRTQSGSWRCGGLTPPTTPGGARHGCRCTSDPTEARNR